MKNNNQDKQEVKIQDNQEIQHTDKKNAFLYDCLEIIESTIITVFVLVMIFTYLLHPVSVVGTSMVPTLNNEDRVFMTTIVTNLSCGDIVVINNDAAYLIDENTGEVYEQKSDPLDECIIKRIIACGGQTVDIDFYNGIVTVDGEVLDEPYINEITQKNDGAINFPLYVPDGYYFVMGDNRNHSSDSRCQYVGLIKKDQIYGKAVIRYSPFSQFKIL